MLHKIEDAGPVDPVTPINQESRKCQVGTQELKNEGPNNIRHKNTSTILEYSGVIDRAHIQYCYSLKNSLKNTRLHWESKSRKTGVPTFKRSSTGRYIRPNKPLVWIRFDVQTPESRSPRSSSPWPHCPRDKSVAIFQESRSRV